MRDLKDIGKTRLKDDVKQRIVFVFCPCDLLKVHGIRSDDYCS